MRKIVLFWQNGVKWTEGNVVKTDNNHDQVTDRLVSLSFVVCAFVCTCEPPKSCNQHKGKFWSTDLSLLVFQLHRLETSSKTTTVHLCSVKMVTTSDQLQQWGLLHLPLMDLSRNDATLPSISSTVSSFSKTAACAIVAIRELWAVCREIHIFPAMLINAVVQLAWWGYERAPMADVHQADLSLSPFISCLACNHPVSAEAAAWLGWHRILKPGMGTGIICRYPLHKGKQLCKGVHVYCGC